MSRIGSGLNAGGLIAKEYSKFQGVDFTDNITSESRSPDALNMWKNYRVLGKQIETRPELDLQLEFENNVYGLFFYTVNNIDHWIIHSGVSLYDYNPFTKKITTIKSIGMNPRKSSYFIYNNILFIIDGINYLEYDGSTLKNVVGTIPITSIARKPEGGGTQYQDINLISDYRKNSFWGDGESKDYYLDTTNIDNSDVKIWIDDILQDTSKYTIDSTNGLISFVDAPEKAIDQDNVVIQFKKNVSGYANKLKKCTLTAIFDNRVFFSGNQDYPNTIFWCSYNDPRFITDMNYALEGTDLAKVKAMVPGNNALWVFKESSQANTTVFYHTPLESYDERLKDTVKTYPSVNSSISTGCKATGINFNDDIVFFSNRGMEGISGNITSEQILGHRSTLIDRKLLNEINYENMTLVEYEGYLLVLIDNKVYLADSRQKVSNLDHIEYEWFYWELNENIQNAIEHNGILYLCSNSKSIIDSNGYIKYTDGTNYYWYDRNSNKVYDKNYVEKDIEIENFTIVKTSGIYTLTNENKDRNVYSYWTTLEDDFSYPQMLKTTNKRGFKTDVSGNKIKIDVKTDNNDFEELGTYLNTKGYIVSKLKRKKWNKIQLRFSSDLPFGLYAVTLESYIGSYVKRS